MNLTPGMAIDRVVVAVDSLVFATYLLWGLFVVVHVVRLRRTHPEAISPYWFLGALLFPFVATLFLIWFRMQERKQEAS